MRFSHNERKINKLSKDGIQQGPVEGEAIQARWVRAALMHNVDVLPRVFLHSFGFF